MTSPQRPRPRGRIVLLLYGIVALALAGGFGLSILLKPSTTARTPPIPTVTPPNRTPLPTAPPIPTTTPLPTATPEPTATPGATATPEPTGTAQVTTTGATVNVAGVAVDPPSGPVGAVVQVFGAQFPPGDEIHVGISASGCASAVSLLPGAYGSVAADGTFDIFTQWPVTQPGQYTTCVVDVTRNTITPAGDAFNVTNVKAAMISTSQPHSPQAIVAITGERFTPGSQVELTYGVEGSGGCDVILGVTTVSADGAFLLQFQPPITNDSRIYVVTATDPVGACGAGAAGLSAQTYFRTVGTTSQNRNPDSGNPFNLPTLIVQVVFIFSTLSGVLSLAQFAWGAWGRLASQTRRLFIR